MIPLASFFCFAISVEMVKGMDQIQEGISLGPSWICSSYSTAMSQPMACIM